MIDAKSYAEIVPSENVPDIFKRLIAEERRNSHLADFSYLFGDGVKGSHREFLKQKLESLKKEIIGLRHLFSHRHEQHIQKNHRKSWDNFNFHKFELWFNEFFKIVQKLMMLHKRIHHRGMSSSWEKHVNDQMDLILFGTIDRCIELFCKDCTGVSYSIARKKFYESRDFIDLLVVKEI